MAKPTHTTAPEYCNPLAMATGEAPSLQALDAARRSLLCCATYRQHGLVFVGTGTAYPGSFDSSFVVFYPVTYPVDGSTTRRFKIVATFYDDYDGSSAIEMQINGSTVRSFPAPPSAVTNEYMWSAPHGAPLEYYFDVPAAAAATITDGVGYFTLSLQGASLHTVCVYAVPEKNITWSTLYGLASGNFSAGDPLRGYDDAQVLSVDTLAQMQTVRTPSSAGAERYYDCVINNSRGVLFGWGHGQGIKCEGVGAGLAYINVMSDSFRPKISPLNLQQLAGDIYVDVAIAYRADADTKIKFTSTVAGSVFEKTITATATTATASFNSRALQVRADGDYIRVEVYCSTSKKFDLRGFTIAESAGIDTF